MGLDSKPVLIDCPACNSLISNQAAACPKCGQPINPPQFRPENVLGSERQEHNLGNRSATSMRQLQPFVDQSRNYAKPLLIVGGILVGLTAISLVSTELSSRSSKRSDIEAHQAVTTPNAQPSLSAANIPDNLDTEASRQTVMTFTIKPALRRILDKAYELAVQLREEHLESKIAILLAPLGEVG
jgi:hypothetical protein